MTPADDETHAQPYPSSPHAMTLTLAVSGDSAIAAGCFFRAIGELLQKPEQL